MNCSKSPNLVDIAARALGAAEPSAVGLTCLGASGKVQEAVASKWPLATCLSHQCAMEPKMTPVESLPLDGDIASLGLPCQISLKG